MISDKYRRSTELAVLGLACVLAYALFNMCWSSFLQLAKIDKPGAINLIAHSFVGYSIYLGLFGSFVIPMFASIIVGLAGLGRKVFAFILLSGNYVYGFSHFYFLDPGLTKTIFSNADLSEFFSRLSEFRYPALLATLLHVVYVWAFFRRQRTQPAIG